MIPYRETEPYWRAFIIARNKMKIARFLGGQVVDFANDNEVG